MAGVPQIIRTSDPNKVYRETDRALTNLLPTLQAIYGQRPIIFWKYDISNPQKWVKEENTNYIFGRPASVTSTSTHITSLLNQSAPQIANIGSEDSISKYCGQAGTIVSSLETSGTSAPRFNFLNILVGNERPNFSRRNMVSEFIAGDEATSNRQYLFTQSQTINLPRNSSKEQILSAWQSYLNATRLDGENQALIASKTLYFVNQRNGGQEEAITNFSQLQQLFPHYFMYDKQFQQEALSSLVDGQPKGYKIYADGQWWNVETNYIGLWNQLAERGLSSSAITRELLDMGYTMPQINAIRGVKGLTLADIKNTTSGSGSATPSRPGGGGNTGGRNPNGTAWTGPEGYRPGDIQNITIQRSRNVFFTSEEIRGALSAKGISIDNSSPVMYQVYRDGTTNSTTGEAVINQYIFDVIPNEINYGGFGGEWVSIERVGGFPFIDWKSFKLLQISFQFTIADKNGRLTGDGLDAPVTDQIELLQRMAQTPFPVMFYGFDTLLTNQFRYDETGTPRGVQFVIQDLSISATRRNANMEITRATANITLQEMPIEKQSLIGMPRLKHKPKTPEEPPTITDPEYGVTSDNLTDRPKQDIEYPP